MFIPEAELPAWVICYVLPIVMSILNILPTPPKSFPFLVPYLLFENTMSVTKFNAMVSGLFQLGSAYEWVITKKTGQTGHAYESDLLSQESKEKNQRRVSESGLEMMGKLHEKKSTRVEVEMKKNRIYRKELALAFLLLTASARSFVGRTRDSFLLFVVSGVVVFYRGVGFDRGAGQLMCECEDSVGDINFFFKFCILYFFLKKEMCCILFQVLSFQFWSGISFHFWTGIDSGMMIG
ncbi:hypothetical protein CASFOL_018914 [Castilleja foliolosa]|uniref:Uncharacterized protein n=1 Tax=Castilleja foliolosa TaxID=1961234 RepID=A0ABD3D2W5_9LAMI